MPYKDTKKQNLWRLKNPEYHKEWRKKNKEYYKEYRKNPINKLKNNIRSLLNYNIATGSIIKPNICEKCKKVKKLEGHHEDYNKPLEVKWLCKQCHAIWHSKRKLLLSEQFGFKTI